MNGVFDEKKQAAASSRIRFLILLLILTVGFLLLFEIGNASVLRITDQSTGEEYYSIHAGPSDILTYGWIHSFEHIPWTEQYTILGNNNLLLKEIAIAGFGAGIPHNKGGKIKSKDGMIIMSEINEEYDEINWIHSQTATDYIMLNDKVILRGTDLPQHKALNLKIEKRLKLWLVLKLKTN
jgi:hypothetical protein